MKLPLLTLQRLLFAGRVFDCQHLTFQSLYGQNLF